MKPDFDAIARDIQARVLLCPTRRDGTADSDKVRELIAAQLRLYYQEGICDGLRQGETAIKAAFDKFQGRVEP